jgi:hypothetical protein
MNKLACLFPLLFTALLFGCAGSADKNPAAPSSPLTAQSASTSNRHLWGIWDVHISSDRQTVEIAPLRTADMHLNAVKLLEVKPCTTCLTISNLQITGPNELSADLTLIHPFPGLLKYTGFDVRGIFISQTDFTFPTSGRKTGWGDGVPRMLDPDGYTSLFNPTEFPPTTPAALGYIPGKYSTGGDLSANLNPFVAYREDAPRRMFEAGGSETKTVKIYAPTGPIHFGYAVDVCWQLVDNVIDPVEDFPPDANCLEAYAISVDIGPGLEPFAGSSAPIEVEVYDHQGQDTISSVTIEAPDLFTGEMSLTFSTVMPDGGFLFTGTLSNDLGAPYGPYPVLAKATDTQTDQNLGEVAAWQVSSTIVSIHQGKGWARTWGGTDLDEGFSTAIDGTGNVYVTGHFWGTVDFDPGAGVDNHTSNGGYDVFLSKLDPNGNFVWARTWGGSDEDHGYSIAIDGSGYAYITGSFGYTVDFDPGPGVDNHTSNGVWDAFLSKFDPNGNFIWARTWGGPSLTVGLSVAIDGYGDTYTTGWFIGTVDFDPGLGMDTHTSNGSYDVFLSKFDPSGDFVWARTWGGPDDDSGNSVVLDGSDDTYVTGFFEGTADFDPGAGVDNHSSDGDLDAFLSKLDPDGNLVWALTWGGPGYEYGASVATDSSGNAYTTGVFTGTVDFDPGAGVDNHTSDGNDAAFLSKIDPNGNFVWARTWGGPYGDIGLSIAIDGSENAYVTGFFDGTADFDPGAGVDNHTSNGYRDTFLSKIDSNGNFVWARTWGGSGWEWGNSVTIDGSGNAYVTGEFGGTVDFDPGAGLDNHKSNGAWDVFLSKFPPDGNW